MNKRFLTKLIGIIAFVSIIGITGCTTSNGDKTVSVDKTELTNAIATATTLNTATAEGTAVGNASAAAIAAYAAAIAAAQAVVDNAGAAQAEVDSAVITLAEATVAFNASIVVPADKTQVLAAIATANALYTATAEGTTPGKVPTADKSVFAAAIAAAQAVADNAASTGAQYGAAIAALSDATVVFNASIVPAPNKTALTAAIAAAGSLNTAHPEGIDPANVDAAAKTAFITAIAAAQSVASGVDSLQAEVDTAVANLASASSAFIGAFVPAGASIAGTIDFVTTLDAWNSGTVIVAPYTSDYYYNSVIKLTSGSAWGTPAAAVGFISFAPGKLLQYTTLVFKIRTTDYSTIKVQMTGAVTAEPSFSIADGTPLAGGWTQMSISLTAFGALASNQAQFGILITGTPGIIYLTDIGFTGVAPVNTAGLTAAIAAANILNGLHGVGVNDGEVSQAAKDAYTLAISDATSASDATWAEINATVATLALATTAFNGEIIVLAPTTLPSAPALPAADVICLLNSSATYSNIAVKNWDPDWGNHPANSIVDVTVGGKTIKKLTLASYMGVDFSDAIQNITGKTTLHFSYWTANGVALKIYAVNVGDTNGGVTMSSVTQGAWTDLEIDLSASGSLTNIQQMKFDTGSGIYFFDNIYFH